MDVLIPLLLFLGFLWFTNYLTSKDEKYKRSLDRNDYVRFTKNYKKVSPNIKKGEFAMVIDSYQYNDNYRGTYSHKLILVLLDGDIISIIDEPHLVTRISSSYIPIKIRKKLVKARKEAGDNLLEENNLWL